MKKDLEKRRTSIKREVRLQKETQARGLRVRNSLGERSMYLKKTYVFEKRPMYRKETKKRDQEKRPRKET